jgi:putative transport protein
MLDFFVHLNTHHAVAYTILMLAVVIAGGLILGGLKVRGVGLGSAGVLFAGLIAGQFGQHLNADVLGFLKEFGLVLFVFTIGLQLGPGFAASLRAEGLRLNLLSGSVVVMGSVLAVLAAKLLPIQAEGVLGVLAGAVTNTPSLGATQQAISAVPGISEQTAALPAIAYAVAYPGGIVGIIGSLLLLRWWLRIDPATEGEIYAQERSHRHEPLQRRTLVIDNPHLDGMEIGRIPGQHDAGVTISRLRARDGKEVETAHASSVVHLGDRLLVVGTCEGLDRFHVVVGTPVDEDLVDVAGKVTFIELVVTSPFAAGHVLGQLRLAERFGVTVTRVRRSGIEVTPEAGLRLHFGDQLHVVGEAAALQQAGAVVGNEPKAVNQTHFAPIFLGIALGVIVGSIPVALPGLPAPVQLGLAGGPLLIAILLGRLGSFRRLIWHMPDVANHSFRELGIALFLASVGLKAGPAFFATVMTSTGILWFAIGLVITVVPLVSVGWYARNILKMNFMPISGCLTGAMTDPPALAFANTIAGSEGPSAAYATVYPLTMILRIVLAQVLVVLLCG